MHVIWERLDMLVDEVSAEGPRVLVRLQPFAFWQFSLTKTYKAYRWSLFSRFDANRSDGLRKPIVTLI
jgi:hypothetical protein